jgi:hypothetical protein
MAILFAGRLVLEVQVRNTGRRRRKRPRSTKNRKSVPVPTQAESAQTPKSENASESGVTPTPTTGGGLPFFCFRTGQSGTLRLVSWLDDPGRGSCCERGFTHKC